MAPNEKGIGRPYADGVKRSGRLELRLTPDEVDDLDQLADALATTKAGVIRRGLALLKEKLNMNHERG